MLDTDLNLGSFYRRRDGKITKVTKRYADVTYPFETDMRDSYTPSGRYDIDQPSYRDLVEELVAPMSTSLTFPNTITSYTTTVPALPMSTPVLPSPYTRHKHSDVIKAWADGQTIEYKGPHADVWRELEAPGLSTVSWKDNVEYRVKVKPVETLVGIVTSEYVDGTPVISGGYLTVDSLRNLFKENLRRIYKVSIDRNTYEMKILEEIPM